MEQTGIDRLELFVAWAKKKKIIKGARSFEVKCGLSEKYIYNLKYHGKGSIGSDKIALISKQFPMLNVKWLCTGEGSMIIDDNSRNEKITEIIKAMKNLEKMVKSLNEMLP